ncbi:CoF synthetase [Nereida sp. MMG025]|uniref:CoF synthetase n=1 Tax=Nereida sp. MMG025 TaxID=2909981 RepID=UPI001F1B83E3|nr:CoF synthetase [Nereida sp. MMG025]MCF6443737.1 CoF synthetase [Nereida sp. MMG025]
MINAWEAISSFALTKRMSRSGLSRTRFEQWQARDVRNWLTHRVPQVGFYDGTAQDLCDLPITDKATIMAQFEAFNTHQITSEQVRDAMACDCQIGALTVGASSGTSGHKGYFVVSDAERYRWLGTILAKTIGDMLWQKQRVALLLPSVTTLYSAAEQTRRINLSAFDLTRDPEEWGRGLVAFNPTVIVAPPKILRLLADMKTPVRPVRIFAGSETLDPIDRPVIEGYFGMPLRQIYMASEGLLGVTCAHGALHLAEDSVAFEFEPVTENLVTPLISSFRRDTQILARYRMNDLLRLSDSPCVCGSPLQVAAEVIGRVDDIFCLKTPNGERFIPPDRLRNAVTDADPSIPDYRLVQTAPDEIELSLPPTVSSEATQKAIAALDHLTDGHARIDLKSAELPCDPLRKLRRVEVRFNNSR